MKKREPHLLTLADVLAFPEIMLVRGDGPDHPRIAVIGEAPAKEEMRLGMAFVGPSGEILWQWLWKYLLVQRGEVWVDNLFPFMLPDKKGKQIEELVEREVIDHFSKDLVERLVGLEPEYVITLGRYSTRALLGDVDMEWAHGIGFTEPRWTVIPCYHPAAGLHSSDRLQFTALDLQAARRIVDGEPRDGELKCLHDQEQVTSDDSMMTWHAREVAIDTEGTASNPYCLTTSTQEHMARMIRATDTLKLAQFRAWLEVIRPVVVLHNSLHDLRVLRTMGIDLLGMGLKVYDTMSAAHCLQDQPRGLKPLAKRLLGATMKDYDDIVRPYHEKQIKRWLGEVAKREWRAVKGRCKPIPKRIETLTRKSGEEFWKAWTGWELKKRVIGTVGHPPSPDYEKIPGFDYYAKRDADVTLRAKKKLQERIEEAGVQGALDLDLAIIPFLDQVMQTGLYCDLDKLTRFHADIQGRKLQQVEIIRALVEDEEFNPGSADQVEARLRPYLHKLAAEGRCRLTKSKKRYQVDSGVLEQLRDEDPLVPAVIEYRELDKLDGTYLSPLYGYLQWDEESQLYRLPLNLRHAYVVSGRLSSHEPNVLAWPSRTEDGLRLRGCFLAPKGWMLGSWDLSQIEMRLAAGFSQDKVMLKAFEDGVDLHTETASKLFGVKYEEVDKFTQRTPTKTVSYLILYGGTEEKMFVELKTMHVPNFDRMKCARTIAGWKAIYPGVWEFMVKSGHEAAITGEVRVPMSGRRRFLPAAGLLGKRWPCSKLREEAARQAGNMKIQGGAQDLIKRAEIRVMDEVRPGLHEMGVGFEPCLQMHDEIVALVKEEHWEVTNSLMVGAMLEDEELMGVRLECEGKMAKSWGELK